MAEKEYGKLIEHDKIEKCKISKKNIDTTKDDYSIIIDCRGEMIMSVGFYKTDRLREVVQGNMQKVRKDLIEEHQKKAAGMMQNINPILNKILGGSK